MYNNSSTNKDLTPMDIFLEKSTERVAARISKRAKAEIASLSELKNMNESQYIKLAIQNQITNDRKKYKKPTNVRTT